MVLLFQCQVNRFQFPAFAGGDFFFIFFENSLDSRRVVDSTTPSKGDWMTAKNKTTIVSIARNYREAPLRPASLDVEKRTVEVVWATTTPVLRIMWEDGSLYWEELSLDPECIILDRFNKGLVPVLDSHNRHSTDAVYGVAENPTFPEGQRESICTARFSKNNPKAEPVFKDIQDGILRGWSFGYDVLRMVKTEREIEGLPVYVATLWEPFELSVVPVPADPNAGTRDKESMSRSCEILHFRGNTMTEEEKKRQEEEEKKRKEEEKKRQEEEEKKRQEEEEKSKSGKKSEPDEEERARIDGLARTAERRRISEIRAAYETMPTAMDPAKVNEFIENGASADDFRRELLQAMRSKQPKMSPPGMVEFGSDQADKKREAMSRALLARAAPGRYEIQAGDAAREFRGLVLIDVARRCLEDAGISTNGMSRREIAETALGARRVRGMHVTNDFPHLLSDTINKVLRDAYKLAQPTYQPFCNRASFTDFKERHLVQISDVGKFVEIPEGGEYKYTSFGEAKEKYGIVKYGNRLYLSWESIINDDLSAFHRLPTSIAIEAAQHCADIVYGVLLKNPVMGDGYNLFCAEHGNLGTAADIDLAGMDAAFTAMGEQENSNGRVLNLTPEFLIIGHSKRTKALQYLNDTVVPTKADDVTPAQMRGLSPIVEGRVKGSQWFLACNPGYIDTIEYAYLEGKEGLFTEERWGFEVDGLEIKARLVFGAAPIDWRGLYMNPGI
ncbi:MAG: HK97 family phage prohead protease [Planctomycetaceae bacterium]|nr:HK97 family phage prohead protease [Planctomycetaceae bacterium]